MELLHAVFGKYSVVVRPDHVEILWSDGEIRYSREDVMYSILKEAAETHAECMESMRSADMNLRMALTWEGTNWGSPASLHHAVEGVVDKIQGGGGA